MAGILPNEGKALTADLIINQAEDFDLILITNASISETTTGASLTQPSGSGYAPVALNAGSWTGVADSRTYPKHTFTATGVWAGGVTGYAIVTRSSNKIIAMELEGGGPYTFAADDTYDVTPTITVA